MAFKIYNTMTNTKEEFVPTVAGKATMYNCGPTVYDYAHIGNFRAWIFADTIRRYLDYLGYEVTQVMNITDVGHLTSDADEGEDKMEVKAREEKKDPWQIAAFYSEAFFEDVDKLNIRRAHHYPKATDHIQEMIEIVQKLIERGYAYESGSGVYYDVTKFAPYGRLSGNTLSDLMAGARVEVHPDKRNPFDFALWIADPNHIMQWDSPWARGYPGWHVECSAMSMKYLGETLDIHTGGEDNIFPHHECEIAQSEGANGKTFVNYWMHTRHLLVDNQKMSKSLGNFYTLRDLIDQGYDAAAIRYLLFSSHYRQPLNFTLEGIDAGRAALKRLRGFLAALDDADASEDNPEVDAILDAARKKFEEGMDDDLNVSVALGAIFDLIRDTNKISLSRNDAAKVKELMNRFDIVLGVMEEEELALDGDIESLISEREQARKDKNFQRADEIRDELLQKGIVLEDSSQGTRWKRA